MRKTFLRATALLMSAIMLASQYTPALAVGGSQEEVAIDNYSSTELHQRNLTTESVATMQEHQHVYDQEIVEDTYLKMEATCENAGVYYKSCACGEVSTMETFTVGEALGHSWNDGVVTTPATEESEGVKTYTCTASGCGATKTESIVQLEHQHVYNQEVAEEKYLKIAADCETAAVYYKSCVCGDMNTETFVFGGALGHSYSELIEAQPEVHTQTELRGSVAAHYICLTCNAYFPAERKATTLEALTSKAPVHCYGDWINIDVDTHWKECSCGLRAEESNHAWDAGEVSEEPGTNTHGEIIYTCVCGRTKIEPLHLWNNGELTKVPSATETGEITYTCKIEGCGAIKKEVVAVGATVTTRADLEAAVAEVAWDYYLKGKKIQYDSTAVDTLGKSYGGHYLVTENVSPEYGTADTSIYSVCSDYAWKAYYEALGCGIYNCTTSLDLRGIGLFGYADNQPGTDNDIKTSVIRWGHPTNYSAQITAWDDDYGGFATNNGFADMTLATTEETQSFLENWENNLRPGDIITDNQHTMLYVGNGKVLHCSGPKYNTTTGAVGDEPNGAILLMTPADYLQGGSRDFSTFKSFIIQRPSELYVPAGTDTDGELGNDIVTIEIPENTRSRLKYPGMEIDRTVDITPFGTVVTGESLTYTIKINNKSNNSSYRAWSGDSDGTAYKALVVTESIPDGTELAEGFIDGGGTYNEEDRIITWNLAEIVAGSSVTLSYKVNVTAAVGSTIANDGGMVADIPSNSISNIVGGAKLGEKERAVLTHIAGQETSNWPATTDLSFVNGVYDKLGTTLSLPTIQSILTDVFEWKHITASTTSKLYEGRSRERDVFMFQSDLTGDAQTIRNMMVDGYWGGYLFYTGVDAYGTTINEFKMDYLEPGDIIVYVDTNNTSGVLVGAEVMIYAGDGTLISKSMRGTANNYSGADATQMLWNAFLKANDLFFVLRPSQVGKVPVHNWTQTAQDCVTTTYVCTSENEHNCGRSITVPSGHGDHACGDWSVDVDTNTHTRTCMACQTYTETEVHTWTDGETAGTQKCDICGVTRTLDPQNITFLVPNGATVLVKIKGGTGAISSVDGQNNVYSLQPNTYVYSVFKEGFYTKTGEFEVVEEATIEVSLTKDALCDRLAEDGLSGIYAMVLSEHTANDWLTNKEVTFGTPNGIKSYTITEYEFLGSPSNQYDRPRQGRICVLTDVDEAGGTAKIRDLPRKTSQATPSSSQTALAGYNNYQITGINGTTLNFVQTGASTTNCNLAENYVVLVCGEDGTITEGTEADFTAGCLATVLRDTKTVSTGPVTFAIVNRYYVLSTT